MKIGITYIMLLGQLKNIMFSEIPVKFSSPHSHEKLQQNLSVEECLQKINENVNGIVDIDFENVEKMDDVQFNNYMPQMNIFKIFEAQGGIVNIIEVH